MGSKAHVEKRFGSMSRPTKEAPKPVLVAGPDFEKLSAYLNLDNGSGKNPKSLLDCMHAKSCF